MSNGVQSRLAVLYHKRRQQDCAKSLSLVSDRLGEPHMRPLEADVSLQLQAELRAKIKTLRQQDGLERAVFPDASSAIRTFLEKVALLKGEPIFDADFQAISGGFFVGPLSEPFLRECLSIGCEGFCAALQDMQSGAILDVAFDDPLMGDFFEVEWW